MTVGTAEPKRRRDRRVGWVRWAAALLALFLVTDVALGALLTATGLLWPLDRGDLYLIEHATPTGPAPRALADEPWADTLAEDLTEFQTDEYRYAPWLQNETYEFHSEFLNTTARERVSYQPRPSARDPLRVAFFGGSVVFGIGQRDRHTIPSEFARIAEENGVPVEVHNYGFPRWVIWQEYEYLERILAEEEEPFDLIVFLDGFNEFYVQGEQLSDDPTHHAADALAALIADFRQERAATPSALDGLREMAQVYRRNSAFWRVTDRIRGRQAPLYDTSSVVHGTPQEQADAALGIYARALGLVHDVTDRRHTPVRFFWQPQAAGWPTSVTDRLPPDVIDLSGEFDGREDELYFDLVHTNEEGARILAQAMWDAVAAELTSATAP